ncbi:MAG: hypothetical protein Q8M22_00335 [Actinomycetota bacterium]|nr:hypothetical protein [Actinomycetota bacterium]
MQVNPPPPPPPPGGGPGAPSQIWGAAPKPPKRRMRKGWIISGILVAVFGLLMLIGGAVASLISRTASSLDPVAEARTPGTATFEAKDATYDVLLVRRRADSFREASDFLCTVTLANGKVIELDGRFQAVSDQTANTESIGSFDAVPGHTSVFCDADGGDNRFVVDEESLLQRLSLWFILGGTGVLLLGTGMILGGVFLKKTTPAT